MKSKYLGFVALSFYVGAGALAGASTVMISPAFAAPAVSFSSEADMKKLIGTNIKNGAGDTVGEVKSVVVDKNGKISDVVVSVGGFLGVGDREVALAWQDLTVTDEGKHVTTAMTKDAMKALPEYKYKQATYRGTVFHD